MTSVGVDQENRLVAMGRGLRHSSSPDAESRQITREAVWMQTFPPFTAMVEGMISPGAVNPRSHSGLPDTAAIAMIRWVPYMEIAWRGSMYQ